MKLMRFVGTVTAASVAVVTALSGTQPAFPFGGHTTRQIITAPSKPFTLSIRGDQFLGVPLLADVTEQVYGRAAADKKVYLLSLQYNVPAVRSMLAARYRFVRLACVLSLLNQDPCSYSPVIAKTGRDAQLDSREGVIHREKAFGSVERRRVLPRQDVRILSIYPTNELLTTDFENTRALEGTLQPSWSGAAA